MSNFYSVAKREINPCFRCHHHGCLRWIIKDHAVFWTNKRKFRRADTLLFMFTDVAMGWWILVTGCYPLAPPPKKRKCIHLFNIHTQTEVNVTPAVFVWWQRHEAENRSHRTFMRRTTTKQKSINYAVRDRNLIHVRI